MSIIFTLAEYLQVIFIFWKGVSNMKFKCLPVDPLRITSKFGPRNTGITGASTNHLGIDLGTNRSIYKGTNDGGPVKAVLSGKVISSYFNNARGWVVLIDHGTIDGKNIKTLYQHLKKQGALVGSSVKAGDTIGIMGNTGTGAQLHLHFELRVNNVCLDPEWHLKNLEVKMDKTEAIKIIKDACKFEDQTMQFLDAYKYADALLIKLATAIKKGE